MYPSHFVMLFCGVTYFQLHTIVISCPPSNDSNVSDAKVIKFCSGSEVTSSFIYIDSSDVSTRVTHCACNFSITNDSTILLTTTLYKKTDCRTSIKHGVENFPLVNYCGTIDASIGTKTGYNNILLLTNGGVGLKPYCLKLVTENQASQINMKCFKDSSFSTTPTTSYITTEETTVIDSVYGNLTTGTTTSTTNEQHSTAIPPLTTTTITTSSPSTTTTTTTFLETDENQSLPLSILVPVVGGGVLLVIMITVIVCCRRKRKTDYDQPGPKADPHSYMNHAVVPDDDGDEMRDNELYRSIDDEPPEQGHTPGYAEVNSTGIRLQNTAFDVDDYAKIDEPTNSNNLKVNTSNHSKNDQNIYSTPSSRPVVDVQGSAIYSMPVKKQKNKQEANNEVPVYTIPSKKTNKQNQVYAMVDKKNKNGFKKGQANASKLSTNKKPPVVAPKPNVVKSGSRIGTENRNADRLDYSGLNLSNSSNTSSSLNFNIGDKTG